MKIAFILPDLSGGGAEKAILNIVFHLSRRNHDVVLILLRNRIEYQLPKGVVPIILSNNPSFGFFGKRMLSFRLARAIASLEESRRFDLTVSTLPLADEIAAGARLERHWFRIANTLSVEVDRLVSINPRKGRRRLERYKSRYGSRSLIAVSEGVKQDLVDRISTNQANIEIIFNPFDFDEIRVRANQTALLPGTPYIVHVGRFSSQKRHDILLGAFKRLRYRGKLVLLTRTEPELSRLISLNGLEERVLIAGFQSNPYPWIRNADLLVLSSDHEGLPNVIIESLVVGTPVVSTDCPSGPREILGKKFASCLVPVGNPCALAEAVDYALEGKISMEQIDLNKYRTEQVITRYESLVEDVGRCVASSD